MEMTREQFKKEIEEINTKGSTYSVESMDSGSVALFMYQCAVIVNLEDGMEGEITIFKSYTNMETRLDFDIIDTIAKENDGTYTIEFNNGMTDLIIRPTDAEKEPIVDNDKLCSFIKDKLSDSNVSVEMIEKILDFEMDFLKGKGLAE